jgi:hypothetical protein
MTRVELTQLTAFCVGLHMENILKSPNNQKQQLWSCFFLLFFLGWVTGLRLNEDICR